MKYHGPRFIDMTGWKMWEHGFPESTLIIIKESDKTDSRRNTYWECQCVCGKEHPNNLIIRADHLRRGDTRGCGNTFSKGEEKICQILKENDINYERQKTFDNCLFPDSNYHAYFDFFINNQYLIEYDGELHYQYKDNGWNTKEVFEKTQQHDKYKNQWCKEHNIPLIRIPYTHFEEICIENLILNKSKFVVEEFV